MEKNFSNRFNPFMPNLKTEFIISRITDIAYKCLYLPNITEPSFISPNTKTKLKIKDKFTCLKDNHNRIEFECSCGFYSFKRLEDAWDYSLFKKEIMIVKVNILGDIIEHDIGYRSSEQIIKGIINTLCSVVNCSRSATNFTMKKNVTLTCEKHKGKKNYSFEEIKKLGLTIYQ